jgi:hypothetical protein
MPTTLSTYAEDEATELLGRWAVWTAMSVNWKRVVLVNGKVGVRPWAAQRGRMTARPGRAIKLLLCSLLSCTPPSVAPTALRAVSDAGAPGEPREGDLALTVPDADAAPEDAESESSAAGADVACSLSWASAMGAVNPVEEGVAVRFLDRGAQLLANTSRCLSRQGHLITR